MIRLTGQMFLRHPADGGGIQDAGGSNEGGLGKIKGPGFQVLLEPSGDRHGKAGFFASKNGFGKITAEGLAQNNLGLAAAQLVVRPEREGVGDQIDVEERNPNFKRVGHGGAVDLHQDAFLQVEFGAEVKEPFQTT